MSSMSHSIHGDYPFRLKSKICVYTHYIRSKCIQIKSIGKLYTVQKHEYE